MVIQSRVLLFIAFWSRGLEDASDFLLVRDLSTSLIDYFLTNNNKFSPSTQYYVPDLILNVVYLHFWTVFFTLLWGMMRLALVQNSVGLQINMHDAWYTG